MDCRRERIAQARQSRCIYPERSRPGAERRVCQQSQVLTTNRSSSRGSGVETQKRDKLRNLQSKGLPVVRPRLADHCSPKELPATHRQLTVKLGQIFPVLIDALANGRSWLNDFDDEELVVSEDLYEVLLAYQHFQEH